MGTPWDQFQDFVQGEQNSIANLQGQKNTNIVIPQTH
jgi:hypothetical protein